MPTTLDRQTVDAARRDVGIFAEALVGERLWGHQLAVVRSEARIRCVCSGRQAGKSRTLAIEALHCAFVRPDRRVLILSAGEDSAKDLLAEVSALCRSPLLAGAVVDDEVRQVTLSNGSTIRSVPASTKQVRGKAIDLLILDEAAFIDDELWRAARYTVIARPGSRMLLASTPYGRRDRFFAVLYRAGLDAGRGDDGVSVESFHWPSTVSPLVDRELLELWRQTSTDREFRAEVLADWPDDEGAWFTSDELEHNVAGYRLIEPATARGQVACAGLDYGARRDASTAVLLGVAADADLNLRRHPDRLVFFVPWLTERFGMRLDEFVDLVVGTADRDAGRFYLRSIASETNGIGEGPTQTLQRRLYERRTGAAAWPVHTTTSRKLNAYGRVKMLLQQGRLVLPRHPGLLRQLAALEFETLESGTVRIAVPERGGGHDDLADGLMQAVSCIKPDWPPRTFDVGTGSGEVLVTAEGTRIFERPRCAWVPEAFGRPKGADEPDRGW